MSMTLYIFWNGLLIYWGLGPLFRWWVVNFHQPYHEGHWLVVVMSILVLSILGALSPVAEWLIKFYFDLRPLSQKEQKHLEPLLLVCQQHMRNDCKVYVINAPWIDVLPLGRRLLVVTDGVLTLDITTQHALMAQGLCRLNLGGGHYTAIAFAVGIWGEMMCACIRALAHACMGIGVMFIWIKPLAWFGYALSYIIRSLQGFIRKWLLRSQKGLFLKADKMAADIGYGETLKVYLQNQVMASVATLPVLSPFIAMAPAAMLRVDHLDRAIK